MKNNLGNKEVMARNILRYMELHGKDRSQVCKDLDISYTTFTDWVKARTYPRIDKIELLANYFGVSKSDLVEEQNDGYYTDPETARMAQEMFEDPDMKSLFHMKRNMSPERFQKHVDMMKEMYRLEHPEDDSYGA